MNKLKSFDNFVFHGHLILTSGIQLQEATCKLYDWIFQGTFLFFCFLNVALIHVIVLQSTNTLQFSWKVWKYSIGLEYSEIC